MKILDLTSFLKFENRALFESFCNDKILTISPLLSANAKIHCEIGALSYVLAMICVGLNLGDDVLSLDVAYFSGESNVGEEEIDEILDFIREIDTIIVDENLIKFDENRANFEILLARLAKFSNAKIINLKGEIRNFTNGDLNEFSPLQNYDGAVVFKHTQNSDFIGGKYFCAITKLHDKSLAQISTNSINLQRNFGFDESIRGTIAFLGLQDSPNLANSPKFELAKIEAR
ncbi:MAG: hypothetical protein ACTTIM_01200 [Campylobacter sp.]